MIVPLGASSSSCSPRRRWRWRWSSALVDNVVKPLLIKAGMEMRSAVVFFSLIGGLAAFGAIGLIVGPLVVALFLALLRIYRRDFRLQPEARV